VPELLTARVLSIAVGMSFAMWDSTTWSGECEWRMMIVTSLVATSPEVRSGANRRRSRGVADGYLRFCASNLCQLEKCIERRDLLAVVRIARMLDGNAGSMGLTELSALGRQLEESCECEDWRAIGCTYRAINDTVARLCEGWPVRAALEIAAPQPPEELALRRGD